MVLWLDFSSCRVEHYLGRNIQIPGSNLRPSIRSPWGTQPSAYSKALGMILEVSVMRELLF